MMMVAIVVARHRIGIGILRLEVDHQHAQRHPDLNRGEADARGVVHRLEHVLDQRLELVIELGDGFGHHLEAGIGDFEDFANGHEVADSGVARDSQPTGRRARSAWASVPSSR
jgi:hypothetical protein